MSINREFLRNHNIKKFGKYIVGGIAREYIYGIQYTEENKKYIDTSIVKRAYDIASNNFDYFPPAYVVALTGDVYNNPDIEEYDPEDQESYNSESNTESNTDTDTDTE